MSWKLYAFKNAASGLRGSQRHLLMELALHIGESDSKHQRYDEKGYFCWPSVIGLAELLGSKRELVTRELRKLEQAGWIRVEWSRGGVRLGGLTGVRHKIYVADLDGNPFVVGVTPSNEPSHDSNGVEPPPNGGGPLPQTGGVILPQTGGVEPPPNGGTIVLSEIVLSDRAIEGAKREREQAPSCVQPPLPLRPPAESPRRATRRPKRQVVPEGHWLIPADWRPSQAQRDRIKREGIRQAVFDAEVDHWRSARFSSAIVDIGGFLLSSGQLRKMKRRQIDEARDDRRRGIEWTDPRDEGLIPVERALEPPDRACG